MPNKQQNRQTLRSHQPLLQVVHKFIMKTATYFLIFLAAVATAVMGIKSTSLPFTATAFGFIIWTVSPYAYLAVAANLASAKASIVAVFSLSFLAGAFGIWMLIDAMFIHLDAQGGLVFLFAPLWQWVFLVLMALPLYFLNRVKNA